MKIEYLNRCDLFKNPRCRKEIEKFSAIKLGGDR